MEYKEFEALTKYTLRINEIIEETEETKTYRFDLPKEIDWEEAAHAHFAHLKFLLGGEIEEELVHHMSVNGLTEEGYLGFTTRVPGSGSIFKKQLQELTIGDQMIAYKFESRIPLRRESRPIVLLSMGVGMSTMRPLIHAFCRNRKDIPKLININIDSNKEYVYEKEINQIKIADFCNFFVDSRVDLYEAVDKTLKESCLYYIIGSDEFIIQFAKYLLSRDVLAKDIVIDKKEKHRHKYIF